MDNIDRILMSEEAVAPSATFGAGVMDVVEMAAADRASLPFPWGRWAAGVVACVVVTASGAWLFETGGLSMLDAPLAELAAVRTELGYAAATVGASLAGLHVMQRCRGLVLLTRSR